MRHNPAALWTVRSMRCIFNNFITTFTCTCYEFYVSIVSCNVGGFSLVACSSVTACTSIFVVFALVSLLCLVSHCCCVVPCSGRRFCRTVQAWSTSVLVFLGMSIFSMRYALFLVLRYGGVLDVWGVVYSCRSCTTSILVVLPHAGRYVVVR